MRSASVDFPWAMCAMIWKLRVVVPDWPLGSHELPLAPGADGSLPGLGKMVSDFLDALELEDAILVSSDTGTAIAQQVAAAHPERLGGLVLGSGDCFEHFFPARFAHVPLTARLPGGPWLIGKTLLPRAVWHSPMGFGPLVKSQVPE